MNILQDNVKAVIDKWNSNCKAQSLDQVYELKTSCRVKKFYLNKNDFYEQRIAEITLLLIGKPNLMLWRYEARMPEKVKGVKQSEIDNSYIENLYKNFLYECVGNFCITTKALITSQDYAEWDIQNDRLQQHESAKGMIISTLENGEWYEKGNDFDVFMQTDIHYFVYTAVELFRSNNGIGRIDKNICLVKENAKPSIMLLQ